MASVFGQLHPCVTPCVGVWIETDQMAAQFGIKASHPAWVCGLKRLSNKGTDSTHRVTPCVGVWIETYNHTYCHDTAAVTPCVGVWIETLFGSMINAMSQSSHPAWVCGLKLTMWLLAPLKLCHTLRGCVD